MSDQPDSETWPPPPSTVSHDRDSYDDFLDKRYAEMPESERQSRLLLASSLRGQYGLHLRHCVNIVTDWGNRRGHAFAPLQTRSKILLGLGCLFVICACIIGALDVFVHDFSPATHAQRIMFYHLCLTFDLLEIGACLLMIVILIVRLVGIRRRQRRPG